MPPATQPLTAVDRAWLRMDEPTNLMLINGVLLFDEPLSLDAVKQVVEERLLSIPRFRQRVARRGRWAHWEEDPQFDVDEHVVEEVLPPPADETALQQMVSRRMSEPLDPLRPLWRAHVVRNLDGGAAILWRLHHCIGDGIALMLVLLSLTESADGEGGGLSESPLRALFGPRRLAAEVARRQLEKVMPEAVKLLVGPPEKLKQLGRLRLGGGSAAALGRLALKRADPRTLFKGDLGGVKRAVWSRPLPLDEVRDVCGALGGTVNDLLTTAVAGGLRHYLLDKGERADGLDFRTVVPVNLRPLEEMASLGNQFGLVFLPLPIGVGDPVDRLAELRRRMGALKRSLEPVAALGMLHLLGLCPPALQRLGVRIFGTKGTAVLTNVPGPHRRLYLAGQPIRGFVFWVPQSGSVGIGLSIASYAGEVRLGVATDSELVPDPEIIVDGFHREFDALKNRARKRRAS